MAITFLGVYLVMNAEEAGYPNAEQGSKASSIWYWSTTVGLFLVGCYLPVQLAYTWPLPVLPELISPAAGAIIITAPGVLLGIFLLYRTYQNSRRWRAGTTTPERTKARDRNRRPFGSSDRERRVRVIVLAVTSVLGGSLLALEIEQGEGAFITALLLVASVGFQLLAIKAQK